jgi:parallel beta-helix repeat protein
VATGQYASGQLQIGAGGMPTARLRFVSDVVGGAKVYVGPVSLYHYAWYQTGSYVDIIGFDVSGDVWTGIDAVGADVHVIQNRIHDIPAVNAGGGAGILVEATQGSATITDNVVYKIGTNNLVHGIYLSASNTGTLVQNNLVYENGGYGIQSYHCSTNATIANNTIFANGQGGVVVGGPEAADGACLNDYITVSNNIVYNNTGDAFQQTSNMKGTHNAYLNNLAFGNSGQVFDFWSWQVQTEMGTVELDPQFKNYQSDGSGDYHLAAGSPAINTGTATGAPATDMDGYPRPYGPQVDIGAYEWHP